MGAATGGAVHTGDHGSSDRRGSSYRRSWEQRQEGQFIPDIMGAVTGGAVHTGDHGSSDRRGSSSRRSWEQRQEGQFIPEIVGEATGGAVHTGNRGSRGAVHTGNRGSSDRRGSSYRKSWENTPPGSATGQILESMNKIQNTSSNAQGCNQPCLYLLANIQDPRKITFLTQRSVGGHH